MKLHIHSLNSKKQQYQQNHFELFQEQLYFELILLIFQHMEAHCKSCSFHHGRFVTFE